MARTGNESQFKFLISCIRYSNNGKVDFGEVARECGIVTKGAAAKRYERMMKAHGIHPLNPSVRDVPVAPKNKDPDKMTALKKRKLDQFSVPASAATDDDEGLAKIKNEVEKVVIKDEPTGFGRRYSTAEILQYPTPQGELTGVGYSNTYRSDDGNAFNDFIHSGAFGHGLPEPDDFQVGRIPPIYGNMMAAPQPHESQPAPNEIILITD